MFPSNKYCPEHYNYGEKAFLTRCKLSPQTWWSESNVWQIKSKNSSNGGCASPTEGEKIALGC
jgi:hypothetical protein